MNVWVSPRSATFTSVTVLERPDTGRSKVVVARSARSLLSLLEKVLV